MDILVQLIGGLGILASLISFQCKKHNSILAFRTLNEAIFAAQYLMLGAYTGFLLNALCVFRAIVYSRKNLNPKAVKIWFYVFTVLYFVSYALTFTVFNVEITLFNAIIEFVPIIGMCFVTVSFGMTSAGKIRAFSTINSCSWLAYNVVHSSIGGIVCEVLSLISIVIGIIRYDLKKTKK